jgi:hypothetical protein
MRTGSVRCDRILALIDACLDDLAQEVVDVDRYTTASTPVEAESKGGSVS